MKMKNKKNIPGRIPKGHKTPKDFQKKSLQGAITPKTKLSKLLKEKPQAAMILMQSGMGCCGCPMAQMETIEQGCKAHGMSDKEIKLLVKAMNDIK